MQQPTSQFQPTAGDLVSFDQWIRSLNRTRATGHRWRRQFPWLKTINIFGKLYIRRKTIEEFEQRAFAGEFEKDTHPNLAAVLPHPGRPRKKARASEKLIVKKL